MGGGYYPTTAIEGLAASASLICFVIIFGGFIVTERMLNTFNRSTDPLEYTHLMGILAAAFLASYSHAVANGYSDIQNGLSCLWSALYWSLWRTFYSAYC